MPLALAASTEITVTTEPNSYVMVRIFEAGSRTELLESFLDRRVNFNGQVIVTHTSDASSVDLEVFVKEKPNGVAKYYKRYESVAAGSPFSAILPENLTLPVIPSANETNAVQNATANSVNVTNLTSPDSQAQGITGSAIGETGVFTKIRWQYLVAGAVLAIILAVGGVIIKKRGFKINKTPQQPVPSMNNDARVPKEIERELMATRRQLESTTKELRQLKNETSIREIEKNVQREQEEIRRLREGK